MCKNTVDAIKRKHRTWTRFIESRDDNSYKLYAKSRNKVKWLVKKEKREREKEIAQTSKNFWKYVNSKRKTASGISELHTKTDDSTFVAESDEDKAEVLSVIVKQTILFHGLTHRKCVNLCLIHAQFAGESTTEDE